MRRPVLAIVQDQIARNGANLVARLQRMTERAPRKPGQKIGCLLWKGAVNNDDYPRHNFVFKGDHIQVLAHIFMWVLANARSVAEGHELDHTCNVRKCVEPTHLEEVTHAENCRRARERRRPTREATNAAIAEGMAYWQKEQEAKRESIC